MLEHLHIKNAALISDAEINFKDGLNILTGETGAGKSMIIDSINFVLGEKFPKDFVRKGEEQAFVEAVFYISNISLFETFNEAGIEIGEDNIVIISRSLNSLTGKSSSRINGKTVTIGMLKALSEVLIDIHGQHEHQSLLNPVKHINLLDKFCEPRLLECKNELSQIFKEYKLILNRVEEIDCDDNEREKKIDILQYQIDEISNAKLIVGEDVELAERKKVLSNSDKILRLASESIELLYEGSDENSSAYDNISEALGKIADLKSIDSDINDIYNSLDSLCAQLYDVSRDIKKYLDLIDVDPDEINNLEERLNLVYNLKRKYGKSIEDILEYYNKIQVDLEYILDSEEILKKLNKERKRYEEQIFKFCSELNEIRLKTALHIQTEIEKQLHDMEMKHAKFKISIERKEEFSLNGFDKVEFLISANAGEELKPLSKIASGGEMSRVMLAIKSVLANADDIETFIFDEIDTGVSGKTAQKVAEKMSKIGKNKQILCITHLPQIASMADSHFLIQKNMQNDRTYTTVESLDRKESVLEIARLMGGADITDITLKAADELKTIADKMKNK